MIAGIAGLLPDIDILFYLFVGISPIAAMKELKINNFHPSFTHSLLWIPIFLSLSFILLELEKRKKIREIKFSGIFFMITLGYTVHLLLDGILNGYIRILFFSQPIGMNLIPATSFGDILMAGIDAILLILWIVHEELRHRISRFI